jgi:type IV secretion system protein VirD4
MMLHTEHLDGPEGTRTHPVVAAAARDLLNKSDAERSGILSTAIGFLSLYRDPIIASLTASSDWRIADLMEIGAPVSLYLVVPPSDIARTRPLIRLILNQIGRRLTECLPSELSAGRRLLLMLDEFPALGRLDFFETTLAFLAGYGVRAFLVAQSLHQIAKAYGENTSILDNCHIRIAFSTNDERTAKRISDALGTATEQRSMRSYGGHRLATWLPHVTESRQQTGRALLTPGEIMQLPTDDAILLVSGCPPIRAKKLRYHEDAHLRARVLPPPPRRDGDGTLIARHHDWQIGQVAPVRPDNVRSEIKSSGAHEPRYAMLGLESEEVQALPVSDSGEKSKSIGIFDRDGGNAC